jgi:hypothetical protein
MRKLSLLFCFILLRLVCVAQDSLLAIKNVSVIDVKGNKVVAGQVVIIKGNKIVSVNKKPTIPKGATIVDATGKFLIPGLWDMHAHAISQIIFGGYQGSFPMFVANGITGVRELGNKFSFEEINRIRQEVSAGTLLGPRFGALTGKVLDGPPAIHALTSTVVKTPEEGRQLVRTYKQQGMDLIKAYVLLSREVYQAIIDEAKRQSLPVAGHVPFSMSAAEVSDLGQMSIEHIDADIFISCSRDETELRRNLEERLRSGQRIPPVKSVETYDKQIAQNFFARLRKNGTWMCPTLIVYRPTELVADESKLLSDRRLKYMHASSLERWHTTFEQRTNNEVPTLAERRARYNLRLKIVGAMQRSGVRLLAGSDEPGPYIFPGFSLHEELELLVEAGLSPIDALRTATINPALFLGKEGELGTVDKGKMADLVLLDANPLEDISNTKKIHAVILNGKLLRRSDLDNLLRQVEEQAKK